MIHDQRMQGQPDLDVVRNIHDPMIKSQLANDYRTPDGARKAGVPTAWVPNDLKSVVKRYLDVDLSKDIDHDVTDWTGEWTPEMEEYMLGDIEYLEPLNDILDGVMIDQGQERASWIENNAIFAHSWMTYNGITPDVEKWRQAQDDWNDQRRHLLKHLRKYFPDVNNFESPLQLKRALTEFIGSPVLDTKDATLKMLAPHWPEIAALRDHRHFATRNKNWGPNAYNARDELKKLGFLERYVCPICLRFHPDWWQIGTETARVSCHKPNLQQIPRSPEFRSLFIAAEGCSLASLDYSAIEVLVAGVFAGEWRLIEACATGDPHGQTAALIVGHPVDKKSNERQMAKIANFGLLFGGGAEGLTRQARDLFNVEISIGQAEVMMAQYYKLYPRLKITKNLAYRAMDSDEKRVEVNNAVGFRRYLEMFNRKPTSWLNTWIQSTAGHGLKSSYPYIMEAGLLPFLCLNIHDELVSEFPDEVAEEFSTIQQQCMIRGMRDVLGNNIPVHVEIALGKVWL